MMENILTRRQAMAGVAVALGSMAATRNMNAQEKPMQEKPSDPANKSRTSLHQEIDLKATPQRVFEVFLDARQFAAFTGLPAEIDRRPGGPFKTFGGLIEGRNVEIIEGQRVVQAWRPASWESGLYSIVHFELKPREGAATSFSITLASPKAITITLNLDGTPGTGVR